MNTQRPDRARRALLRAAPALLLPVLLAAACTTGSDLTVEVRNPPNMPVVPERVERLLLWLPPSSAAIDSGRLATSLRARLVAQGATVEVGISQPLELERADAQRPIVERFRPTHRLDIRIISASSTTGNLGSWMNVAAAALLYTATGTKPIRGLFVTAKTRLAATPEAADQLADQIVSKLAADGVTFAP
jgi:hypothetical protein